MFRLSDVLFHHDDGFGVVLTAVVFLLVCLH